MKIIVDTNIIFSALLPTSSSLRDILTESQWQFYAPNYIFVELFRHKEKLLQYSKLSETELLQYLNGIVENIKFISTDFISVENKQEAYNLCKDVDVKDTLFVALTLELDALLWTVDRKLKNHLQKLHWNKFFEHTNL